MMALTNRLLPLVLVFSAISLTACESRDGDRVATGDVDTTDVDGMGGMGGAPGTGNATAQLEPTQGNNVRGTVTFMPMGNGVHVIAELTGLPAGEHGFHVHETGDCSAPDASSAGGHFNPTGAPHGAPTDAMGERHVGDLGNIEADASGNARYERVDELLALSGTNSIVGKAVIVHANPDDFETQPTGNAGDRLACGVIRLASGGANGMMRQDTSAGF